MAGKFELYSSPNGEYRFRLKAGNGETILGSEGYASKSGAESGIDSVKRNAPDDGRYDRKTATNGSHYFALKAGNGEVIGTSEMYSSASGMEGGIASVKNSAPDASTTDLT